MPQLFAELHQRTFQVFTSLDQTDQGLFSDIRLTADGSFDGHGRDIAHSFLVLNGGANHEFSACVIDRPVWET